MSPPLRHIDGINKMIDSALEHCVILQYTQMTDTVIEALKDKLSLSNQYDPHNDLEYAEALEAFLKDNGYTVQKEDLIETSEETFTVEETINRYADRFKKEAESQSISFEAFIQSLSNQDKITIKKQNILRVIWWSLRS